jgi:Putative Ig domain/Galactose oxidase, central domain
MKKSLLLVICVCSSLLLDACGGGGSTSSHQGPPHFSVAPFSATATLGTTLQFTVIAFDGSNNLFSGYSGTIHFTSSDPKASLPPDTSLGGGTGTFLATFYSVGDQKITVSDTVSASMNGTSSPILVGTTALTINSPAPPTGTVMTNYDEHSVHCYHPSQSCVCIPVGPTQLCSQQVSGFPLTATGGVPPYTWSWAPAANSSLPPGLNVLAGSPPGIYGEPTMAGTYNVTVTVADSGSPAAQISVPYSIEILNPAPPAINTISLPSAGAINLPYSFTFLATGGLAPLTWSESGALPPGLSPLSSTGVLSGTPTQIGSFPITVSVQDSLGQSAAPQNFTIQVFAHGFKTTGSMASPRVAHTATLLNNGEVLVAGGTDANGVPLATAEIYDSSNGTFTLTGSMTAARHHFAATLLPGGKVLLTGGLDTNGNALATAELYDPTSRTFSLTTGSMQFVHASHTATLLNTGKVLVIGWGNATAELYDPSTGTFAATGSMVEARVSHTATLLSSGKVLVAGGIGPPGTTVLAEAELYDPATGSFRQTLGNLATARQWHAANLLQDGKVLVTGGMVDNSGTATAIAELYDPTTEMFTATTASLTTARALHTATVLKDGTVLVAGGENGSPLATAEVYNPTAGTFSTTGGMASTRESHMATQLNDGTVLVTGGSGSGPGTAEVYQ